MFSKYLKLVCLCLVYLLIWSEPAVSFSSINSLPGYSAPIPFKLETGYIGVGDVEFFYYFIESESNPAEDPLMLWLTGGPGCSSVSGLFFEIGPLQYNMVEYNGSLPTFRLNLYSWTKVASIIFLDAPVGTGFSYSRTSQGFKTGDTIQATDSYNFLRKWLQSHPKFITNPLYIGGDSYSGKIVPLISHAIADGIEERSIPAMNLKGYLVGNPITDSNSYFNFQIPYYHRTALISDELYESAKRNCKGEYVQVDIANVACAKDLQAISECVAHINKYQILEPQCPGYRYQRANSLDNNRKIFLETHEDYLRLQAEFDKFGCRSYEYYLVDIWANDVSVRKALNVRMETIGEWTRCNLSLDYVYDVENVVDHHGYLNMKGYRALIYSGDHDAAVPYLDTLAWIRSLNLSIVDKWRPWFDDDQVAGYSTVYQNNLIFATLKGGGHTALEYRRKEGLTMFQRWVSQQAL